VFKFKETIIRASDIVSYVKNRTVIVETCKKCMGYYKKVTFLAISKNTYHYSTILLVWNKATHQFLQVTHNTMQFVCKNTKLYNFIY